MKLNFCFQADFFSSKFVEKQYNVTVHFQIIIF